MEDSAGLIWLSVSNLEDSSKEAAAVQVQARTLPIVRGPGSDVGADRNTKAP
jgi:hypothetical protein